MTLTPPRQHLPIPTRALTAAAARLVFAALATRPPVAVNHQ